MEHRGNYKVAYNDLQMIARGIIFCTYRASSEGVWLTYGAALSWSFLGHSALMIVYQLHDNAPFIYKKIQIPTNLSFLTINIYLSKNDAPKL